MNNEFKDYYRILGVTPEASQESIRRAYEREMKQNWRDAIGRLNVDEAYYVLSDVSRRRQYDESFNAFVSERERALRSANTSYDYDAAVFAYPDKEVDRPLEEPTEEISGSLVSQEPEKKEESSSYGAQAPVDEAPEKEDESKSGNPSSDGEQTSSSEEEKEDEKTAPKIEDKKTQPTTVDVQKYLVPVTKDPLIAEKRKKLLIVASGYLLLGVPGVIIGAVVAPKIVAKMKLNKEKKAAKITKAGTDETRLIEEYNRKLEDAILELLSKPNKNYELEIAKLKYSNQIELLERRIQFKENQTVKRIELFKYNLELMTLRRELQRARKTLEYLNGLPSNYNKNNGLVKLNDRLITARTELEDERARKKALDEKLSSLSKDQTKERKELEKERKSVVLSIKKLEIKSSSVLGKRDKKANKLVLSRNGISRRQAIIARFSPKKKTEESIVAPIEQQVEGTKTR